MSSSEFDIIAILYPAEGKSGRVIELLKGVIEYVQDNEPGTLKYELHKEQRGEDIVMVERYAGELIIEKPGWRS
jgi:quinol monooxygenase YgiN